MRLRTRIISLIAAILILGFGILMSLSIRREEAGRASSASAWASRSELQTAHNRQLTIAALTILGVTATLVVFEGAHPPSPRAARGRIAQG